MPLGAGTTTPGATARALILILYYTIANPHTYQGKERAPSKRSFEKCDSKAFSRDSSEMARTGRKVVVVYSEAGKIREGFPPVSTLLSSILIHLSGE